MSQRSFEAVEGFFVQEGGAHPGEPEALPPRFGLKDTSDDRWEKFKQTIDRLNTSSPANTQYKVFFVSRHGEGFHNVAEAKYGKEAWDNYWSKKNGDGELVWGPDPELTYLGKDQAKSAHDMWKEELEFGIPLPGKLYCSPLTRAIQTNVITFDSIIPESRKTMIFENLRELNGVHTCDKRGTRAYIERTFPGFDMEEGFTEQDELWDPELRETYAEIDARVGRVLDVIFERDEEQFVSITGHGGVIGTVLRITKQNPCKLPTGGVLAMVIKSHMS